MLLKLGDYRYIIPHNALYYNVICDYLILDIYFILRYNLNMNTETTKRGPRATSIRLSETADELWERLSQHLGISKQAVIEMALRKLARTEGVPVRGDD